MLYHFHVQNDIELLARRCQSLGGGVAVVDPQACGFCMLGCHGNVARGRIRAQHFGTQAGHRFGKQAAAASDIQDAQSRKRMGLCQIAIKFGGNLVGDVVKAAGVHQVKWPELAQWIPPICGHRFELSHFGGVNSGLVHCMSFRGKPCGGRGSGQYIER